MVAASSCPVGHKTHSIGGKNIPSTGKPVSFPELVRSWSREKNLPLSFCLVSTILSYILIFFLRSTDKCSYHPLSKKLLFIADGEHHTKAQMDHGVEQHQQMKQGHRSFIDSSGNIKKRRWKIPRARTPGSQL